MKQTFVVTIEAKKSVSAQRVKDHLIVAANMAQDHPGTGEVVEVIVGTDLPSPREPRSSCDACPECGARLYVVQGLCHDRDGMRNNRWCEECKVMYSTHASGFNQRLVLKDAYEGKARERIAGLLHAALNELEAKKKG
jgi:hypothetical protein